MNIKTNLTMSTNITRLLDFQTYTELCNLVDTIVAKLESYRGYYRLPPTWILTQLVRAAVGFNTNYFEVDLSKERMSRLADRLESSYVFDGEWRHILSEIWNIPLHGPCLSSVWDDIDVDEIAPKVLAEKGFTVITNDAMQYHHVFDDPIHIIEFGLLDWEESTPEF